MRYSKSVRCTPLALAVLSSTTVDWPIRFVFGKNAQIREVKHRIDGQEEDPSISPELNVSGGDMYAWVDDGTQQTGSSWDKGEGKKEGNSCALDNHMRFYAQSGEDRNYNATWEYYIVATLHVDYHKRGLLSTGCDPYFWIWESDEDWWVDRIEEGAVD